MNSLGSSRSCRARPIGFLLVRDRSDYPGAASSHPGFSPNSTLPNRQRSPAQLAEASPVPAVPFGIGRQFLLPECPVGRRQRPSRTRVPVPETAVDKDGYSCRAEGDVRGPRKVAPVHSVPKAAGIQSPPDAPFRLRIGTANRGHYGRALSPGEHVQSTSSVRAVRGQRLVMPLRRGQIHVYDNQRAPGQV